MKKKQASGTCTEGFVVGKPYLRMFLGELKKSMHQKVSSVQPSRFRYGRNADAAP